MKTRLLIAISCWLLSQARADNFDKWFEQIIKTAPRQSLKITNDEAWREWFWLYCYEPKEPSMTPKQAVLWTIKEDRK